MDVTPPTSKPDSDSKKLRRRLIDMGRWVKEESPVLLSIASLIFLAWCVISLHLLAHKDYALVSGLGLCVYVICILATQEISRPKFKQIGAALKAKGVCCGSNGFDIGRSWHLGDWPIGV